MSACRVLADPLAQRVFGQIPTTPPLRAPAPPDRRDLPADRQNTLQTAPAGAEGQSGARSV